MCGGQHLTASNDCAQRFKIPYIVCRHRSEHARMADAASPSPKRHLDTADEFQSSSPTTDNQRRGRPRSRGRSGGFSGPRRRGASKGCSGSRSRSTERARGSSTSQLRSTSRPGPVSSGPTRSRSRSPATSNSKKPTLSWADKAR
nr:serine/arginine-rich splicing factor 2-like [Rhipicephalus microplus]